MLCSSIIGHFVPADVWCKLVRAAVGTASGSTRQGRTVDSSVAVGPLQCEGCLLCFASLLQGGRKDQIFAELNVCLGLEKRDGFMFNFTSHSCTVFIIHKTAYLLTLAPAVTSFTVLMYV